MKRTTLPIDADIKEKIDLLVKKQKNSLRAVVNDLLRAGLASKRIQKEIKNNFTVVPFKMGIRPGIDQEKFNQLANDLETEDLINKC